MKVIASSLRKGNIVEIDDKLYAILSAENIHPGKGTPVTQVDMRRLNDGVKSSLRFKTTDQVERAHVEEREYQYLYEDGDGFHFMNMGSMTDRGPPTSSRNQSVYRYGYEGAAQFYEGTPVGTNAATRDLEVVETELRQGEPHPAPTSAVLSNGVRTICPVITVGTRIIVMTADGTYSSARRTGRWSRRSVRASLRSAATTGAVIRPVFDFPTGRFSSRTYRLPPDRWPKRAGDRRIRPDLDLGTIRPDAGERQRRHDVDVSGESLGGFARAAGKHPLGGVEPDNRNIVCHQIGRTREPARRFAGDHAHRLDLAFGGGGHRIEAKQRAGRNDDLAAARSREFDQVRPRQERAGAQHHDPLARCKHGPADRFEHARRRALDRKVAMLRQRVELDQRRSDPLSIEPCLRFGAVAGRNRAEREPWNSRARAGAPRHGRWRPACTMQPESELSQPRSSLHAT